MDLPVRENEIKDEKEAPKQCAYCDKPTVSKVKRETVFPG